MLPRLSALLLLMLPVLAPACQCLVKYPLCSEVQHSSVVFIGTVEAVAPAFLDRSKHDVLPMEEIARLRSDHSADALAKLKAIYVKLLGGIPAAEIERVERAASQEDLRIAFEVVSGQRLTRFRVSTVFATHDDDDDVVPDNKNDDDKKEAKPEVLDVWTDAGDCGIDFQTGETYIVYAGVEEISNRLQTGICSRTRRLTDAGSDMAYLYHLHETPQQAIRVEGFVTTNLWDQYKPFYSDEVIAPVRGLTVQLKSGDSVRSTTSAGDGRFIFDGLAAGDYQVSVLAGEPFKPGVLKSGPRTVHAAENSCPFPPVMLVFPN